MEKQIIPIIEAVERELASAPQDHPYAVFDFDNTCVINDIQQALMAYICKNELIRYPSLLGDDALFLEKQAYHEAVFRHYWKMINQGITFEAYIYALRTLVGYREDEAKELCRNIIRDQGSVLGNDELFGVAITKGFQTRSVIRDLMIALIGRGVQICVVSASPWVLVKESLHYDSFPDVPCIGTRLKEESGVFIDSLVLPAPVEKGKILCIQEIFGSERQPILGAGDSMNDFLMLEYSGIQVAIDRGNQLVEEARHKHWYILTD